MIVTVVVLGFQKGRDFTMYNYYSHYQYDSSYWDYYKQKDRYYAKTTSVQQKRTKYVPEWEFYDKPRRFSPRSSYSTQHSSRYSSYQESTRYEKYRKIRDDRYDDDKKYPVNMKRNKSDHKSIQKAFIDTILKGMESEYKVIQLNCPDKLKINVKNVMKNTLIGRYKKLKLQYEPSIFYKTLKYREKYSKEDDIASLQKFVNDECEALSLKDKEKDDITDHSNKKDNLVSKINECDDSIWNAVDEVLQDIDLDELSSVETKDDVKVSKQLSTKENVIEIIDMTHDTYVDPKTKYEFGLTIVYKINPCPVQVPIKVKEEPIDTVDCTATGEVDLKQNDFVWNAPSTNYGLTVAVDSVCDQMKVLMNKYIYSSRCRILVWKILEDKILKLLNGREYSSNEIVRRYRSVYPEDSDEDFIHGVIADIYNGVYDIYLSKLVSGESDKVMPIYSYKLEE